MRRVGLLVALLTASRVVGPVADIAFAQSKAYVTNQATNQVNVLSTIDWTSLPSIAVGSAPTGISIPASGAFAYVANRGSNSVSRIDLATGTVTATIPVPGNPTQVAVKPDGSKAYVVQSTNCPPLPAATPVPGPTAVPGDPTPTPTPAPPCTVAVIDATTDTVARTLTVGRQPFAVALSPSGGFAYVTNRTDGTLSVIDTAADAVVDVVPVGASPEGVAAGAGVIEVANNLASTLTVIREIDLQVLRTIPVGAGPLGVAVSPDGRTAIVSNDYAGTASLVSTDTLSEVVAAPVGSNPAGVGFLPNSATAVVANNTGGSISVVSVADGSTITVPLPGSPSGVAIHPEPVLTLLKTATPYLVPTGGTATYSLSFLNSGSGTANGLTLIDPIPDPGFSLALATGGGSVLGPNVVWNLGTLGVGASGAVQVVFDVSNAMLDGTLVTNVATIVDGLGHAATAEAPVRVRVPGSLDLGAIYKKSGLPVPRGVVSIRTRFPLPPGFDGSQQVDVSVTTATQLLYHFTIPPDQIEGRRDRYKYAARAPDGSRIRLTIRPDLDRLNSRFRFRATALDLPFADSPLIRVTLSLGPDVFSVERLFEEKAPRRGGQKLVYQD